MIGEYKDE
ncbi:Protein of unknown function [Bacillus cereus]|nr:Protein of unknown function [Bacillus cereus]